MGLFPSLVERHDSQSGIYFYSNFIEINFGLTFDTSPGRGGAITFRSFSSNESLQCTRHRTDLTSTERKPSFTCLSYLAPILRRLSYVTYSPSYSPNLPRENRIFNLHPFRVAATPRASLDFHRVVVPPPAGNGPLTSVSLMLHHPNRQRDIYYWPIFPPPERLRPFD